MKSLTGKFASARGWALLLTLFLGAGFMVAACGEEDTPSPTTPTPPPTPAPAPEPEPEPPGVPTGLRVNATGADFIEWAWTMVEGVSGYDVQFSANEAFTTEDEITARTAEQISYRQEGLEAETNGYLRVRSASGAGEDRVTSDWSAHVGGMTAAAEPEPPPVPEPTAPATPTGFEVSDETETSITWSWEAVEGADGYLVQISTDEMFEGNFEGADRYQVTTDTSHTVSNLAAETTLYARVAAGVLTAAAPSLDPADYLLSAWTTHATGMTEVVRLPVPKNLRRTDNRGHNFIEWEWDEVPGADGYHSEFSTDGSTFSGFERHAGRSDTIRRVSGLDPGASGYLRVRSYTGSGTGADTVSSEWSEADRQSTGERPAPEPLSAPTDVRGGNVQRGSITVTWDEVDGAESYVVEQSEDDGDWTPASCSAGNNVVTTEECVATDLRAGTDYDFRVRALTTASDRTASGWGTTPSSVRTRGSAPTDPVPGGTGDLKIRWSSTAEGTITFTWERVAGKQYRTVKVGADKLSSTNPCEGAVFGEPALATAISATTDAADAAITAGTVVGLCVKVDGDDTTTSSAFGVSLTGVPTVSTTVAETYTDQNNKTTNLHWTGINVVKDFDFEIRVVTDLERDNRIAAGTSSGAVQTACSDGDVVRERRATRTVAISESWSKSLDAYAGYLLCVRHKNDAGSTSWAVPADNAEIYTLPAAPPAPAEDSNRRTKNDGDIDFTWEVDLEGKSNVPWEEVRFDIRAVSATSGTPKAAECDAATDLAPTAVTETLDGLDITHTFTRPMAHLRSSNGYICIRASYDDDSATDPTAAPNDRGTGPWTIGGRVTLDRKVATLEVTTSTSTAVTLTLEGHTDDAESQASWSYKANRGPDTTCTTESGATLSRTVVNDPADTSNLQNNTSYTYTAYGDAACKQRIDSVSFTTKRASS